MHLALLVIAVLLGLTPALASTRSSGVSTPNGGEMVVLTQKADAPVTGRFGMLSRPELRIRCMSDRTALHINYDFHLTVGEIPVTTRIDDEPVKRSRWTTSSNHHAIGLWPGESSISFIRSLIGKKQLHVQLRPYRGRPVRATFSLTELGEKIDELADICG